MDVKSNKGPLHGVVACLTGMSAELKDQYHSWIEALGGKYTRDFFTCRNTHLVAQNPSGEKYETAMDCPNPIHVVKPSWLEACHEQNTLVSEEDHSWRSKKKKKRSRPSLQASLDEIVASLKEAPSSLFATRQFLLVGFDMDSPERLQLCRIIRNGMGTIFWEFHDHITHVIVHDHCDDALRASVSKAKSEIFGDFVEAVSPWWLVESWKKNELLSPKLYPPSLERKRKSSSNKSGHAVKKHKRENTNKNLFRGQIFVVLRISNANPRTVDYNNRDLENLVRSNGGQILSLKLLETLKAEHATLEKAERRKCHVVCFSGGVQQQRQQFSLHPLLAQILRRELCELVCVTPNWLQTCVKEQSLVDPSDLPLLYQPQAWAWRKLVVAPTGKENQGNSNPSPVRISVTGFQGATRTAIVQAIQDMGAIYDDSMHQKQTTHLICCSRNKSNPKFVKALEWGITVVSVDWVYHVLQNGLDKEENEGDGAHRFTIKSEKQK